MSNASKHNKAYGAENQNQQRSQGMSTGPSNPSDKRSTSGSHEDSSMSSKIKNFPSRDSSSSSRVDENLADGGDMSFEALEEKIEDFGKSLKQKSISVRRQIVHQLKQNPWGYIAGVSAGSWVVGYFMGRRRDVVSAKK